MAITDPNKIILDLYDPDIDLGQGNGILKLNQPYILDLVTLQTLYLQTVPFDIEVNPDSAWYAIATPGRNVPIYQYTGSEKIIEFTITWYADTKGKQDAYTKAKWLESLTQNDGYDKPPHPIKFVFGELFKSSKWIVGQAKYTISQFDRTKGMMPGFITQNVILKRISEKNPVRSEILSLNT